MAKKDPGEEDFLDTSPERMKAARNNRLTLLVERVERLREEKKAIADDEKDVFAEMKAVGYDTKVVRALLTRRKMKREDRLELDSLLEAYEAEVGLD